MYYEELEAVALDSKLILVSLLTFHVSLLISNQMFQASVDFNASLSSFEDLAKKTSPNPYLDFWIAFGVKNKFLVVVTNRLF